MEFLATNFDAIVKLALGAIAALAFFFALRNDILIIHGDITHIKENQKALSEAFTQLGNILTQVAVQDVRLQMMEKRIDEMSHGQGFVTNKQG